MAENNENGNLNNQNGTVATPPAQPQGTAPTGPSWQELAGVDPKEFDSPDKLAKSYKEARTELSKQGEHIKEVEKFKETAEPILKVLWQDPELFEHFKKSVQKIQGQGTGEEVTPQKGQAPVEDPETKGEVLQIIIDKFEDAHGISKLDADKKKTVQTEIGGIMSQFLPKDRKASLSEIKNAFESSWEVFESRQIKKELGDKAPQIVGGPQGFGTPRTSSGQSSGVSIESLSDAERRVAEKMHMSLEDYAKQKQAILEGK